MYIFNFKGFGKRKFILEANKLLIKIEMQQKLKAAEEEEKLKIKMEKKLAKERRKAEKLAKKKELEITSTERKDDDEKPVVIADEKGIVLYIHEFLKLVNWV